MAASLGQPEAFVDADAVAAFLSVERRQVLEMARRGLIDPGVDRITVCVSPARPAGG